MRALCVNFLCVRSFFPFFFFFSFSLVFGISGILYEKHLSELKINLYHHMNQGGNLIIPGCFCFYKPSSFLEENVNINNLCPAVKTEYPPVQNLSETADEYFAF